MVLLLAYPTASVTRAVRVPFDEKQGQLHDVWEGQIERCTPAVSPGLGKVSCEVSIIHTWEYL